VLKFVVIVLLILFLLGSGVLALILRTLFALLTLPARGKAVEDAARTQRGRTERRIGAENMLRCEQCGIYVPESQGVRDRRGDFFCSELHCHEHESGDGR
jgi:hypothetical protein